jgi:hypothetical protein
MLFNLAADAVFSKETRADFSFGLTLNIIFAAAFIIFWNGDARALSGFIKYGGFLPQKTILLFALFILIVAAYRFLKPEIRLLPQGKIIFASSGLSYLAFSAALYFAQALVFTAFVLCAGIFALPALAVLCSWKFSGFKWGILFPALLYAELSLFVLSKTYHPAVFAAAFALHLAAAFALKLQKGRAA